MSKKIKERVNVSTLEVEDDKDTYFMMNISEDEYTMEVDGYEMCFNCGPEEMLNHIESMEVLLDGAKMRLNEYLSGNK